MGYSVILGITGGIAAYKTPELIRTLRRDSIDVETIMTESAREFVTPTVLREVTGHPVHTGLFDPISDWNVQHISLAQKADLIAVVPATANIIGKMASGIADDLLSSVLMATQKPILLAPAMNTGMYQNPAVQQNIKTLSERGVHFIGPDNGELLCGQDGAGRLSGLEEIREEILTLLYPSDFQGLHVLITAGPTQEYWDPVRFISNPSSGKMGYALARIARRRGAKVTLIAGPVDLPDIPGVETVHIRTADEMYSEVINQSSHCDISIMAAAPTDYRPTETFSEKIKRDGNGITMCLTENKDIARAIGQQKGGCFSVIFAAETSKINKHAREKLDVKNADLVVANDLTKVDAGFRKDTNRVSLITRTESVDLPVMHKEDVAGSILDAVLTLRRGERLSTIYHE